MAGPVPIAKMGLCASTSQEAVLPSPPGHATIQKMDSKLPGQQMAIRRIASKGTSKPQAKTEVSEMCRMVDAVTEDLEAIRGAKGAGFRKTVAALLEKVSRARCVRSLPLLHQTLSRCAVRSAPRRCSC